MNALTNWITIMLAGLALLGIGVGILVSRERWGRWQASIESWWGEQRRCELPAAHREVVTGAGRSAGRA